MGLGFSLNPIVDAENAVKGKAAALYKAVEKIDADNDGVADLTEVKTLIQKGESLLLPEIQKIENDHILAQLQTFLGQNVNVPNVLAGLSALYQAEQHVAGMLPAAEAALKSEL